MVATRYVVQRQILICSAVVCVALLSNVLWTPDSDAATTVSRADQSPLFEDARRKVLAQDYAGAIVQLHNLLQEDQQHLPARILLGQCYLHSGQAAAAEKEFRISLGMGADKYGVFTPLGNALLLQRKYQEILDVIQEDTLTDSTRPEIQIMRGRAHYELGALHDAEREFHAASEAGPNLPEPLLGLASVAIARGDRERGEQLIDRAIEIGPNDPEAWFQRGEIYRMNGEFAKGLVALTRALELQPNHMRAHLARGNVYIALGDYNKAKDDAVFVRSKVARDPSAALLLWQSETLLGDRTAAKNTGEEAFGVLQTIPDEQLKKQPSLLQNAALLSMARRNYEVAAKYLRQYVELRPNDLYMRKLYGQAQLNLGDVTGAVATFAGLTKALPKDPDLFVALGQSYLLLRQFDDAKGALEHAVQLAPDAKTLTTPVALSKIGIGATDAAVADLAAVQAKDLSTPVDGALYSLLQMKRGDLAGARESLDAALSKNPSDPLLLNLSGTIYLKLGVSDKARKAFSQALKENDHYLAAAYNLAQLDFHESGPAPATDRLRGALKKDPKFIPAMNLLADIAIYEGRLDEAVQWLERAKTIKAPEPPERGKLIDLYIALKRKNEALAAARAYVEENSNGTAAAMLLARVQVALDDRNGAKDSFQKAARSAILEGDALIEIARKQVEIADYDGARRTLEFASAAGRADIAQPAVVRIEIAARNYAEAERRIDLLDSAHASTQIANVLRGELRRKQGRIREAVEAFQSAVDKAPGTEAVLGLYDALIADGQRKQAFKNLEAWTALRPEDLIAARTLAVGYVFIGDLDKARLLHEKLLTQNPNDALLLTDLARIYQLQKRPEARNTAERALRLEPQSAGALDTLGWILATEGDLENGLKYLREAIARDANPLTRFHLASVLHELKLDDEAKIELNGLLKATGQDPLRADAQRLYDSISERDRQVPERQ